MTSPENNKKPEDQAQTPESPAPIAEPVYAPASERVPRTVPDYGDVVSKTDTGTPERQASSPEPSYTRPSYSSTTTEAAWDTPTDDWMTDGGMKPKRFAWVAAAVAGGIGVWLYVRWKRERNKPINRLRRQARQAAGQARERASALREQMPNLPEFPDEARRPAIGLGTALLPLAVLIWQRAQSRSRTEVASRQASRRADKMSGQAKKMGKQVSKQAADTLSESDWMARLQQLKDAWTARRVEIEKVKITRR
jgi:hypothetical protein